MNSPSRTTKTLALSMGRAVASFGALAIAVVLSRMCEREEDYATYRQSFLAFKMLAPFLGLGLGQALLYFLPTEKTRQRGLILENLGMLALTGIAFLAFMLLGGNQLIAQWFNNPALATTLLIIAPIALFQLPLASLGPCMIARDNVFFAAAFGAFSRIGIVIATLVTFLLFVDIQAAIWANVLATGVACAIAITAMFRICTGGMPRLDSVRQQIAFGVPLGIGTMVGTLSKNLDRTMVAWLCPTADYAIFENGALELPLVAIITGSMTSILLVDYRAMLAEDRVHEVLPLMHRAMLKSATVLLPVMCLLLCVAPEFMVCLFGERYRDSSTVFRVYLLMLPVRTLAFSSIALASGRVLQLSIVPVIALAVNAVLNYVAITRLGYVGGAIATVFVVYFVSAFGRALIAKDVLKCSLTEFIPWKQFGLMMFLAVLAMPVVLIVRSYIPVEMPLIRLVVGTAIYGGFTSVIFFRAGYIDRAKIRKYLSRKKNDGATR